jgi:uncharacterized protein (DUF2147 family)
MTHPGRAIALAVAILAASTLATFAVDPIGTWLSEEGAMSVTVTPCGAGGALCASIAALTQPTDPTTGRPKTDTHNPDASKRNSPLVRVHVLFDMRPQGANKWAGRLYNIEDDNTYDATLSLDGPNTLKIEGCVFVICKTRTLTRKN